tara:strand:+ start:210 stop:353 length:144 start_codon:yes stop_codon:yes gene_type:complete
MKRTVIDPYSSFPSQSAKLGGINILKDNNESKTKNNRLNRLILNKPS